MTNGADDTKQLPNRRQFLLWVLPVYIVGLILWFIVWSVMDGYEVLSGWLWWPFFLCPFVLLVNMVLCYLGLTYGTIRIEMDYIAFVERNASYIVTAILVTFLIVRFILPESGPNVQLPKGFTLFLGAALISSVVGVLPLYWIPPDKPIWLQILRHWKTVPITYSIAFFLGGVLTLLGWLTPSS